MIKRRLLTLSILLAVSFSVAGGTTFTRVFDGDRMPPFPEERASERLVDFGSDACVVLESFDEQDGTAETQALDDLRSWTVDGDDTWVADRVATGLAGCEAPSINGLFVNMLEHSSVNLRWRAIRHFGAVSAPPAVAGLESLWKSTTRAWVRIDLIHALTQNESAVHLEDCLRLVESEDIDLALAALEALRRLEPPGALERMVRIVRSSENLGLVEETLQALGSWADSEAALRAVVVASRSERIRVAAAAATSLSAFRQSESTERLLELVASNETYHTVRRAAFDVAVERDHPGLVPALLNILAEPEDLMASELRWDAANKLAELGLVRGGEFKTVMISTSCGFRVRTDGRRIVAPADRRTIRCWMGPRVHGDPDRDERLPAGRWVHITDHFEAGKDHWVELGDCWVPYSSLGKIGDAPYDLHFQLSLGDLVRREFDVELPELESPATVALIDLGLLDVLETDDAMAVLVLEVDTADEDQIRRLADAYVPDESILDDQVWNLLDEIDDVLDGDGSLGLTVHEALERD